MNDWTLLLLIVALSGVTGYELGYQRHADDIDRVAYTVTLSGPDVDGESVTTECPDTPDLGGAL